MEDPPTVDEVLERQRVEYPEQAESSTQQPARGDSDVSEETAVVAAGGEPTGTSTDGTPDIEGPNSA